MPIDNLSKITSRSGINTTILLEAGNANVTGIVTAAGFDGPFTGGSGSDINAGIVTAANGLHVGAGGTIIHAMSEDDGKVGIGITNPTSLIHAQNDSVTETKIVIESTGTNSYPAFRVKNDAKSYDLGIDGANDGFRIYDVTSTTERLRITGIGSVGINEDQPKALLHVATDNGQTLPEISASFPLIVTKNSNSGIAIIAKNDAKSILAFGDTDDADRGKIQYVHTSGTDVDSMQFLTAGGERFRITSGGNALFGGAAVSQTNRQLALGSNSEANLAIETHNTSASETANIRFYRSRGTAASPTTLVDEDIISQLFFYGHDGTDYANPAAAIRVECDGTVASNQMPGAMSFHTNSGGTSATERLRIAPDGKAFLHGTSATSSNNTSALLPAGRTLNIHGTGSNDGISVVRYSGSYGAYGINIGRSRNDTFGTNTAVQDGDELGHVTFYGADGTNFDYAAQITGLCDGAVGTGGDATDMPGALSFRTTPEGSDTPTEALRITSGQLVGIATNTPPDWCRFSIDHGQYGLTRFSNHSHLLLQNKNAGTTDFWSLATRDNGSITLARGTTDSNGTVASAGNSRFGISSAGRVGIGSDPTAVSSFFEANYTSGTVAYPFETENNSVQSYSPYDHEVTIKNNTIGTEDNFCGIFFKPGAHSDGNRISCARISAIDVGDYRADLVFGTRGYRNSAIKFQEVLRLDHDGHAFLKTGNLAFANGAGIDFSNVPDGSRTIKTDGNKLDDYEEGEWTPAYSSTGGTYGYTTQNGHYTKVGNMVTVAAYIRTSSVSATSHNLVKVTGLPFAEGASQRTPGSVRCNGFQGTLENMNYPSTWSIESGQTFGELQKFAGGGNNDYTSSTMNNSTFVYLQATYYVS